MSQQWYNYPITHSYITTYAGPGTDTPHYADDVATPFHTPLTALESGTVLIADYQPWGGEIFVRPDDGSTEWYMYHLDQLNVVTGQHVNAGDQVGLSGGENPGYPGALHPTQPQYSTGPHTHVGLWTGWTSTPDHGQIPIGPDITPLLKNLITGKQNLPAATNTTTNTTPSGTSVIPDYSAVQPTLESGLVRTGLFLAALVIVAGGLYVLFKDKINSGVRLAAKAAVLA